MHADDRSKPIADAAEVFKAEFEIAAKAEQLIAAGGKEKLLMLLEYQSLVKEYKSLLQHAVKMTNISDMIQRKLIRSSEALEESNAKLMAAYAQLQEAQEKSNHLLLNILPEAIAERLKKGETIIADRFENVTVLFADIVGFTAISSQISAEALVRLLGDVFTFFDDLCDRNGLEKIKTIGDNYMVVGGLPEAKADHAESVAEMSLEMLSGLAELESAKRMNLTVRIGIHTGAVVAGVIGRKKFVYDLWGDTVNTASRMESQGVAGKVQVSETTYKLLESKYLFGARSSVSVKGKGEMHTYFLTGRK
ncbi:MAG: adenylate/guanylate cyclase domain-containing protein [Rhizobacter sp.]|nr:adenylate/guanylate cyclase domain-containing protein [Chlorobiales bacterium]